MERHCLVGQSNTTTCKPCEEGAYQETPNGATRCQSCNRQIKPNRKILRNCTKLHNIEYGGCEEGYYHSMLFDYCNKCDSCPVGKGVKKECTDNSNTECDDAMCSTVSVAIIIELQYFFSWRRIVACNMKLV